MIKFEILRVFLWFAFQTESLKLSRRRRSQTAKFKRRSVTR